MMSYTNDMKNAKQVKTIHPSNTQGEIHSKQGFIVSANNSNYKITSPANYSREELGINYMQSNRSSGMIRQNYGLGLKGNDQLNKSHRSQSSLLTDRDVYKSPQFSVVATQ